MAPPERGAREAVESLAETRKRKLIFKYHNKFMSLEIFKALIDLIVKKIWWM